MKKTSYWILALVLMLAALCALMIPAEWVARLPEWLGVASEIYCDAWGCK